MECRDRDLTYAAPLRVASSSSIKETGEIKEQGIFMGDFPLMTDNGTFIINGAERVVVSQLVRSPGVYFTERRGPDHRPRRCFSAKLIPNRGAWLEFETSNRDVMSVKVDRKRKIPVTTLLRAIGVRGTHDEELGRERCFAFATSTPTPTTTYIATTLDKDADQARRSEALLEVLQALRPGDPPTRENARALVNSLFFNSRRYDLARSAATSSTSGSRRRPADGRSRSSTRRTITREDRRAMIGQHQQRRGHRRTTSTTSATAACARSAS